MIDLALLIATFSGPIVAVQAQKWIERGRETHQRKLWIFNTLMATRAARVSPEHVQALNMIDLAFNQKKLKEKSLIEAWASYLDHLNVPPDPMAEAENVAWTNRSDDLFIDLLYSVSVALGYDFTKVHLKRGIYSPRAHGEADFAQRFIRDNLVKVLAGEKSIPMDVTNFPFSEEAAMLQKKVNEAILESVSDKRVVKVAIVSQDSNSQKPD